MQAIQNHPNLELQIVTTASANLNRFGNISEIIKNDGFTINEQIFSLVEGETLLTSAKTTGLTIIELSTILSKLEPDAVMTIADRYETIANAITASYLNIPLIHLQGGDITGNIDEKVRHATTKLSDIHFPTSERSKKRLLLMGENPEKIFMYGCPSLDIIKDIPNQKKLLFDPLKKYGGVGNIKKMPDEYFVVMQHPTTDNIENSKYNILETLYAVQRLKKTIFIFWPNPDAGSDLISSAIRQFREEEDTQNMHFFKNMSPRDFIEFLYHGKLLIGNSSVGIRECTYLGIPVVNIGDRQNNRERGNNVIDVNYDRDEIYNAIIKWENSPRPKASFIYGDGNTGIKIANTLAKINLTHTKKLYYNV